MGPAYWILSTAIFVVMACLIISLNYVSHREYTQEVDRLRREVLLSQERGLRSAPRQDTTVLEVSGGGLPSPPIPLNPTDTHPLHHPFPTHTYHLQHPATRTHPPFPTHTNPLLEPTTPSPIPSLTRPYHPLSHPSPPSQDHTDPPQPSPPSTNHTITHLTPSPLTPIVSLTRPHHHPPPHSPLAPLPSLNQPHHHQFSLTHSPSHSPQESCHQLNVSLQQCSRRLDAATASLADAQGQQGGHGHGHPHGWRQTLDRYSRSLPATDSEEGAALSRQFRLAFNQRLSAMEDRLAAFLQHEVAFCGAFRKALGDNLQQRGAELSAVSEQVAALVESQTQVLQQAEKTAADQASSSQQGLQQLLTGSRSSSDSESQSVHGFLSHAFLPLVHSLQHQLLLHRADLQGVTRHVTRQLQQHTDHVQGFATSQRDALTQLRDTVLQHVLEQQRQLERARDLGRSLLRAKRSVAKELSSHLEQAMKHMSTANELWTSHWQESNQSLSDMDSGLSIAYDTSDKLLHVATSGLDTHIKRAADMSNTYEAHAEEILDNVSAFVERSAATMTEADRLRDDMETGVRGVVSGSDAMWRRHYQQTEEEVRRLAEAMRVQQQTEQEHRQMLLKTLREAADSHEAMLERHRLHVSAFVRERQRQLDLRCSAASDWGQVMTSELRQRDRDVEDFLAAGYSQAQDVETHSVQLSYAGMEYSNLIPVSSAEDPHDAPYNTARPQEEEEGHVTSTTLGSALETLQETSSTRQEGKVKAPKKARSKVDAEPGKMKLKSRLPS